MTTMQASAAPDPLRGALAGLIAGLIASAAMDLAQQALAGLQSDQDSHGGEPATEQAADRLAVAVAGAPVPDDRKRQAGQAVHYGFGALLGLGYGVLAEYWPRARIGGGLGFGIANALAFDEAAVPAAGLSAPPWRSPASTHLYALASHLVFGAAAEGTRRLVRAAV